MSTPVLSGNLLLAIANTSGTQFDPRVSALSDGRFAVVWVDTTPAALSSVKMQILNADGTPDGAVTVLGTPTALARLTPDIATLANGSFVVTYTIGTPGSIYNGPEGDGSNSAVMAQRFDSDGNKLGLEFVVNSLTFQSQYNASITALDDGGFAVVFETGQGIGGQLEKMGLRTFDADGTPRGPETNYPWDGNTAQRKPVITQLANGNLMMAWESADNNAPGIHDTDVFGITARILTAAGVPVTARFGVNTTTVGQQLDPDITALTGGGFVVTWTDQSGQSADTSFQAVRAQVFSAAGVKLGAELLVNTTTLNGQYTPAVTALSDGRFMIAWADESVFPQSDIRVRIFNANGTPSGGELVVDPGPSGVGNPTLVELSDGRVMVSWHNTSGADIAGQIVDPREAAVSVSGTAAADIAVGTRFGDVLNGQGGNDRLFGAAGTDTVNGGAGNDLIDGGAGNDTLLGGAGNDTYVVDTVGDRVFETTTTTSAVNAGGMDTVLSAVSLNLNTTVGLHFVENLELTGIGNASGTGNALANRLTGNTGNNTLNGGAGNDTLLGGAGNDTYVVDRVGDQVFETTTTNGTVDAGGIDTVQSAISLNLNATIGLRLVENLTLIGTGNAGGTGNALANRLTGNGGNNALHGGGGNDTLTGGLGADRFVFHNNWGQDQITDFDIASPTEAIDLSAVSAITSFADLTADHLSMVAGSAVIQVNADTITLTGVTAASLTAGDFIF